LREESALRRAFLGHLDVTGGEFEEELDHVSRVAVSPQRWHRRRCRNFVPGITSSRPRSMTMIASS
jgi:hypothetical protein